MVVAHIFMMLKGHGNTHEERKADAPKAKGEHHGCH
jgi:hypothetical protein